MREEESNNRMMVDARGGMMRIIFIIFCACLIAALLGASAVAQNVPAGTGNETSGDNQSNTGAAVTYIPGANGSVAGDLTPAPTAGAANASGSAMQGAIYHVSVDGTNRVRAARISPGARSSMPWIPPGRGIRSSCTRETTLETSRWPYRVRREDRSP